jgi:hypothetical protein
MKSITDRLELSHWVRRGKINAYASETCKPHMYIFSILYIYTDIVYVDALHRWIVTLARGDTTVWRGAAPELCAGTCGARGRVACSFI